ncbi:Serine/Threonine kinase domain protein (macronuclear) [Tetrahymena thermophila SB210]|uniref:non-specific serine/threonine protein kinase n=1 Tax=Tetrahymena thermophila (strain SB210) TaxID=312017 RepID=Q23D57_TETTS|nr:Serine/Threonine kinase domain protein [Tetrahymena thermophila SB210]EAR94574.2 Serine/Threonine kinase domain protein [Tetrahymena thermophila SB210]|eukprot:XP_001014829.2 Serine/Threonine kinase domain protein [Tetrahymena thermophila SB210]
MQAFVEGLFPNYRYIHTLGEGKLTGSCKVIDLVSGQELCVKLIYIKGISEENLKNMVQMIQKISSINSPYLTNIVNSAYNNDKSHFVIVSEFMRGGNLQDEIIKHVNEKKVILEDDIWNYIFQISNGLKALHENKITHKNLKSTNIYFSEDKKQIKIGDVGIKQFLDIEKQQQFNGCPYSMSPEGFRGRFTKKSDIWSLGCIIYEVAAQTPPFWSNDLEDLKRKVDNTRYSKIINISKHFTYLIESILNPNMKLRPELKNILKYSTQAQFKNSNLEKVLFPKKDPKRLSQLKINNPQINQSITKNASTSTTSFLPKINDFQNFKLPQTIEQQNSVRSSQRSMNYQQYKPQALKLKRFSLNKSQSQKSDLANNIEMDTSDLMNSTIIGHGYNQTTNKLKDDTTKDTNITLNNSYSLINSKSELNKQPQSFYSPKPLSINKNFFKSKKNNNNELNQSIQIDVQQKQQQILQQQQLKQSQLLQRKCVPRDLCSNMILSRKYNYQQYLNGYNKQQQEERQIVFMTDVARVVKLKSSSVASLQNQGIR